MLFRSQKAEEPKTGESEALDTEAAEESAADAEEIKSSNPMQEVSGPEALAEIGVSMGTPETAELINSCRANGGRIFSVGSTSTRTLETVSTEDGLVQPGSGWTRKFIYPGYHYKAVDALITNFHLPGSTLMMLVSAFATREQIMQAYQTAVAEEYRFFSFGDAMLIL